MSVLLLSGGLDSAVVLAEEVSEGRKPYCVTVRYGQRHEREVEAAIDLRERYGVDGEVIRIPAYVFGDSALTRATTAIPLDAEPDDQTQTATVVPGRNGLLISIAVAVAAGRGEREVLVGCHGGDAAIYPDCRETFLLPLSEATERAYRVRIRSPLINLSKVAVVRRGLRLGVPFELTWSCYVGGSEPCGRCGACKSRQAAFEAAA